MEPVQPKLIGKYEILSVIGRGGMGVVYRAQDPLMGRQVAIKTITEGLNTDPGMLQRFYGEAEKMGMLRHPNIVTVYDLGEQNGFPFIVMEYVEGDPLDRLVHSEPPISLFSKLRIVEQVCGALAYAHQNDMVHRDVKPANVIVRPDGVAKLLDFGIARQEKSSQDRSMTAPGGVIGTVPYMAPERLRGAPFDGRSDIFSAGVLLFQVLAGRMPFTGTEYVLVNQILNDRHPPLSEFLEEYPAALDGILERSLAKDPSDRYQSADEMGADLYAVIEVLKRIHSQHLMDQAQQLSSEDDHLGAHNALLQLLKIDPKNIQARVMVKEVGLRVTQKTRTARAMQLQAEATAAVRDKNFDQAIRLLEEAAGLAPDNGEIAAQLNDARTRKQTGDQVLGYLQQAEAAKQRGDYTGARGIVEKAIQLDTNNSRLRAVYQSLVRQAENAARQAKLNSMLDLGREALKRREYRTVLETVKQAEELDPDNAELHDLARAAKEGLLQERRQRLLEDLEDRIANVVTEGDAEAVAQRIRDNLEKTPSDATLLRYQMQIEATLHEYQLKRQMDEIVTRCRNSMETAPLEALATVRKALLDAPHDERLVALEARIQEHIGRLTTEEARASILREANEALRQRKFSVAVSILERCQPPVLTTEIGALLDYAREQSRQEEQQQLVARCYAEAQTLLHEQKYKECIVLLSPVVEASNDTRLRSTLEQAQRALDQRIAEQAAALELVKPYADAGCHEQVVALTQSMLDRSLGFTEITNLHETSVEALRQEHAQMEKLGRAYAGLESGNWEFAIADLEDVQGAPVIYEMSKRFAGRRMNAVDKLLASQVEEIRRSQASGAQIDPAVPLDKNKRLLPFASDAVKADWSLLAEEHAGPKKSDKFFGRFSRRQ